MGTGSGDCHEDDEDDDDDDLLFCDCRYCYHSIRLCHVFFGVRFGG